jgi:hypothetical protein
MQPRVCDFDIGIAATGANGDQVLGLTPGGCFNIRFSIGSSDDGHFFSL